MIDVMINKRSQDERSESSYQITGAEGGIIRVRKSWFRFLVISRKSLISLNISKT
jgi:hypothetical protein